MVKKGLIEHIFKASEVKISVYRTVGLNFKLTQKSVQ